MDSRQLRRRLELDKMMGVDALPRRRRDERAAKLARVEQEVKKCTTCRLHETRTRTVFGRGDLRARLMFVGEAPGADEDREGVPFVGRAGKLLDRMVYAMGLERDEVYITNILKCRPPGNRDPLADEAEACAPYLERQIEIIQPEMICTLGLPATRTMLRTSQSMGDMRGRWRSYRGIPLLPTYHPAYLLRSPGQKAKAWHDLKMLILALQEGPPQALF
ncbi:MAG: uracil-DNA glycosylase [Planctomycetes bacterium]|nr:uracil-DNA glycosylase [Planctomycetota bacterium]